jgi:hypothetical protein
MHRILEKLPFLKDIQAPLMGLVSIVAAYFDSTSTFMFALFMAFLFNILAGLRADEVKFTMWRLVNFDGHKFKDSLKELGLIVVITYFLKGLMDLMQHNEKSVYAVQILVWIALYYYVRNSLRNLSKAYPKIHWIVVVYHLFSFQFGKLMPDSVNKAIEKTEKESEAKDGKPNN